MFGPQHFWRSSGTVDVARPRKGPIERQLFGSLVCWWLWEGMCGNILFAAYDCLWWFMIEFLQIFKYTQCHYFLLDFVCVTSRIPCRCFMAHISFAPKGGSRLDFYVLSGDHAEMRRRQRGQHEPMKDGWTWVEKSRWQTGKTQQKRPTFVIYLCKIFKMQVLKCTTNCVWGMNRWRSYDSPNSVNTHWHHHNLQEVPDCKGCQEFSFESALPLVDSNVTMLIASNQAAAGWRSKLVKNFVMGIEGLSPN